MQTKSSEQLRDEKFRMMTQEPVPSLVAELAVPSVVSILIGSFYNLADTWFISHVGGDSTPAVAAAGVVFSFQAISQAIGFFFGHGSGNFISRALGRRERARAMEMASTGVFSAFFLSAAVAALCQMFPEGILRLLGADGRVMPQARDYFRFISLSMPFFTTQLVLNNQLRLQGNALRGMVGMAGGALLNIGLDALFVFGLEMGVGGASLATAISQFLACLVLFAMASVGDGIPPRLAQFRPTLHNYREILAGGLPSLTRQGLNAVAAIVLNRCAMSYGPDAMAGISIVGRMIHVVVSVAIGIGQGFQPVCGFNFGAGLFHRVRESFFFAVRLGTAILCAGLVFLNAFAPPIVGLFGSSPDAAAIAVTAIRWYSTSLPFLSFVIMTEMVHQNTRQTARAAVLSSLRQGTALLPSVIILDRLFGLPGLLWAQPTANLLALAVATPLALSLLRKLKEGTLKARDEEPAHQACGGHARRRLSAPSSCPLSIFPANPDGTRHTDAAKQRPE